MTTEFTAAYDKTHDEFDITIVDGSSSYTITLKPDELESFINMLIDFREVNTP